MPGTKPGHDEEFQTVAVSPRSDVSVDHRTPNAKTVRAFGPAMTKKRAYSDLSMFQKIGVDGPSSTPLSDFRQALGARYCPSGI